MTSTQTVALIVAAGSGSRMGGDPKQYYKLGDTSVVAHSYRRMLAHPQIDSALVVIGADQEDMFRETLPDAPFILGGASRRESVLNGLEHLSAQGGARRVLIHDAARPLVPAKVIDRLLIALDHCPAVVPVDLVVDTLAYVVPACQAFENIDLNGPVWAIGAVGEAVDRSQVMRIQTPQAFVFETILAAHRAWPRGAEATDDAQIAKVAGYQVAVVVGDPLLQKITHPADMPIVEARLRDAERFGSSSGLEDISMRTRTATGYDVHRLAEGEELWLGGVLIPHDKGLSGHSDADVALHAITDALLGTIAAGDIGTHFPPSDPQWRGAESGQFLEHAASLVAAKGGIIDFVDLTIICEAPKIGPHREAMRARIARLLQLDTGQVSIKATTTERLGFTGRGEGIAAQASVTVRV